MKRETIIVPKGKCPLDVLAEMGERTAKAWIFLHKNAVAELWGALKGIDKGVTYCDPEYIRNFVYDATEEYPKTTLKLDISQDLLRPKDYQPTWYSVDEIIANDIAFKRKPENPEDIFFLQMEE